jgi:hypothetical protein
VHLVLNKVVNQGNQCSKEQASHDLPILDSTAVVWAQRKAAQRPRQGGHQVRDHENVMPIVIIGRCHIGPTAASQGAEDAYTCNELGQGRVWTRSEHVPQKDKGEAGTGCNGNEDLEERPFGISVTDGRRYRGKPFDGVAVVFILDNLVVMQRNADNQRAEEGSIGENSVSPSNPFSIDLHKSVPVSGVPDPAWSQLKLTATTASPSLYRGAMAARRGKGKKKQSGKKKGSIEKECQEKKPKERLK